MLKILKLLLLYLVEKHYLEDLFDLCNHLLLVLLDSLMLLQKNLQKKEKQIYEVLLLQKKLK